MQRGGNADTEDRTEKTPMQLQMLRRESNACSRPHEHYENQDRRDPLCGDRCIGNAVNAHSEFQNQEQVEPRVQKCAEYQKQERQKRVSDCPEDAGADVVNQQSHNSGEIDCKIQPRFGSDFRRRIGETDGKGNERDSGKRHDYSQNQRHQQSGMDRVMDTIRFSRSVILRDDYACTAGKSRKESDHQIDDRADGADGRERFVADKVADDPCIDHVIELLKEISDHQRQRKHKDMAKDASFRHIDFGTMLLKERKSHCCSVSFG